MKFSGNIAICVFVLILTCGCRDEPKSADNPVTPENVDANAQNTVTVPEDDGGYLPVFDAEHGQNTISNRMQKNFNRFHDKMDESKFFHFKSAGLKIYQPENMPRTEKFSGFLSEEDGASVLLLTNPFSMEKTTSQLVSDAVRSGKTGIIYTKKMKVDGQEGVFYLTKDPFGDSFITKCIVAFGNDDFSWIVTGTFNPELESEYGEEILTAILNIKIPDEERLPPGEDVDFTLQPNRLVITPGFIDKVVFTLTGIFPQEVVTKEPIFQAGRALIDFDVLDQRKLAVQLISPTPAFQIDLVSSEKEVKIDDLEGYEFVSIGTDLGSGMPLVIYTMILFDDKAGYVMHGWGSTENEENYVPDFRALAESFKRKQNK